MKITQGVFFTGYTTVKVKGKFPEFFFNRCSEKGIMLWDIKKIDEHTCQANIKLEDVSLLKQTRRNTDYKISFEKRMGLPFWISSLMNKKPLVIGFLLGCMMVFLLSNMVWRIQIDGVTPEIEHKIEKHLDRYGVQFGAWKFNIDTPSMMQQKLLTDIPELLWIGITENGTTYHLQGIEKTIVEEKIEMGAQHLIASKKGVIVDMFVEEGVPLVKVNDFVEEGDMLVSGLIGREDEEEAVRAKGEIIAETWYKSQLSIPLSVNYDVLTGEKKNQYAINIAGFGVPIWGFGNPDYKNIHTETYNKPFYLFKWEIPLSLITKKLWEKEVFEKTRTEDEAVKVGIEQAKKELRGKLHEDADIISEKVLHRKKENGKVKLILYFKVEENIVKTQPITQGD
ncbi:sporulation protein YqfD [Pontibacillus sp. HMF3514]|uniref:sporulation protein YqfD n=1 Tax=Pontibacillus sp. HMF3514 TaxID=2692425 RepID=UPI00132035EB|nr:sporulation protein YqfD [Pontibacillus sp. HMF3514]QHE53004.1 sporulation protein YqfD [Pontibacillus sp. HMF3514]